MTSTNPPSKFEQAIAEYSQGASDVEIAKLLDMTEVQFYELESENPAFATFVQKGRTLAKAWWYEIGRKNVKNKEFNTPLFVFNMKNRHGWADKVETNDMTDKEPVNLEQAKAQLKKQMEKLVKKDPNLRVILGKEAVNE